MKISSRDVWLRMRVTALEHFEKCGYPKTVLDPDCDACDLASAVIALVNHAEAMDEQTEDADEQVARLRAAALDVRLRDAETVGALLDTAREALQDAYAELEHPTEDKGRVLVVVAEALDSLGAEPTPAIRLRSIMNTSPLTTRRERISARADELLNRGLFEWLRGWLASDDDEPTGDYSQQPKPGPQQAPPGRDVRHG